jgi:hypothetical protein
MKFESRERERNGGLEIWKQEFGDFIFPKGKGRGAFVCECW